MRLTLPLSAVVTDTVLNNPAQQVEKKPVVKLFLTPPQKGKKKNQWQSADFMGFIDFIGSLCF